MIDHARLAESFAAMAAIASPSRREGAMAQHLEQRLQALGARVVMDGAAAAVGGECGNLVATLAGTRPGEPLLLAVHLDTVEPALGVAPVLADGVFRSAGETILGADDKAGIAELLEALTVMRERHIPHGPIELVATVCEEVGLLGARHLDYSLLRARRGYALDTSGVDRCIHRAPASNRMSFEILAREAHAGIAPEQGISAIEVAARAIARMRLGRIDAQTTANIGTIRGGQATNIIPRQVSLDGEARSHDAASLARQTAHMLACFEDAARELGREIDGAFVLPRVTSTVREEYPAMQVPVSAATIRLVEEAGAALGRQVAVESAGGGSDANIFNAHGIETVILGTGMESVHTVNESVRVADMARVSELLVELLRRA